MLGLGVGITYSPYNGDGTCKTADQVNSDFGQINGYQIVRMYGVDCNQVPNIISAAKGKGMKIFAGIFDLTNVSGDIEKLIEGVAGQWSIIDTVSIGNELVNQGKSSVGDVVAAVKAARQQLTAAGFSGSVVTVDTFNAIIDNPQLCEVSDYCAANCHAFFNNEVEASGAGNFVLQQAKLVSQAAGGKNTIITESGWPSQGDANGKAIPSKEAQAAAIASLKNTFSGNLFVFNAFNDLWKKNFPGSFNAEQYWGILGS
jgi:exo-beta-1,3-glucanase (GH17 family)